MNQSTFASQLRKNSLAKYKARNLSKKDNANRPCFGVVTVEARFFAYILALSPPNRATACKGFSRVD
jgi:hypothetical protein